MLGLGFHKLENIRKYREDCEQGKFGPLDAPLQYFNWFFDEHLIDTQAKRVPMKQAPPFPLIITVKLLKN
jgi:hypothetical protein